MALRRMLSRRISQSKNVNLLKLKSQLIYTWTIPWLDDYGCYTGDPEDIKTEVFPKNKKVTAKDIENALNEEAEKELIAWYSIGNGGLVQQYLNFDKFQTFKADRERKSDYPQYQPENEGVVPVGNHRIPLDSLNISKVKLSKVKLSKDKYIDFVFLSKEEYEKLIKKFGEKLTNEKIDELNNGIGSKGYKYNSHYHTILSWDRKHKKDNKQTAPDKTCIVCKGLGRKFQTDKGERQIWLCEVCLMCINAAGITAWGKLPPAVIEKKAQEGKAKLKN